MRKKFLAALGLAMIIFLMVALVACNDTQTETYTISFSGTDSAINSISVKAGAVPTIPSVPEKTGYSGVWTLDGNPFNSEKVFDYGKNIELVAQYTLLTYNVVFKADGVQVGETQTYTVENKTITVPSVPAKVGYTGAWETYELTTGDVTINAVYTPIVYNVKFVANGEQVGETQTYTVENKNITVPTVPTKVGYTGVWESYELTTGDITINAVYTINHYAVKFVADGEQVGGTQTYTVENKTITVPSVPAKVGYTGAWETYELTTGDVTINAVYTPIVYNVRFVANGEQVGETQTYTVENKNITVPTVPAKVGYTGAWESYVLTTGDITINAVYTINHYTVKFVADGVQVGETQTYTVEDKNITIPTVPSKVGYTGAWEAYTLTTGDVTVNAVYTAIVYNVKFVADGEQVGETQTYTVENKNITVPTVPAKVGYTGAWETYELTTGDVTVNAVYTAIVYNVKFVADGVQVGETQTYTVENKNITVPSVPTKAGYTGAWEAYTLTTGDVIINAVYTANTDTEYTVEHYFENIDGEYILDSSRTQLLTGTTDTTVNAVALSVEHYSENEDYSDRIASGNINGDGSLVLKLYYALDRVQVTFEFGTTQDDTVVDVRYGAKVSKEEAIVDAKYPYALVEWQKDGSVYDFENVVVENITLKAVFANESVFDDFETENEKWKLTTASSLEYVTSAVISGTKSMAFTTTASYNGIYRQELNELVDFTDVNYIYFKVRVSVNARITLRFFNKNNVTDANYLQLGQDVKADGAWHLICVDLSALSVVGTAFNKTEVKSILIMSSVASSVEIDDVSFVRDNSLIAGVKACYDFEDNNGWKSTGSSTTMNYVTDDALSGDQSIQITTTAWNGLYNQNINGTEFAEVKYIYLKVKTTVATTLSMRLYSGTGIGNNYVSVTGTSVAADGEYHIVRFDVSNWSGLTATGTAFDKNGTKTMLIRTSVATTLTIDDVIFSTSELNIQ